jgi:hypothetical protein
MKYGLKIGDPVYWVVNSKEIKNPRQYRAWVTGFRDVKVEISYKLDGDVFPRKRFVGVDYLFRHEKLGLQTLGLRE